MNIKFIVCEIDKNYKCFAIADFDTYEEAQKHIENLKVNGMFVINKVFFKF